METKWYAKYHWAYILKTSSAIYNVNLKNIFRGKSLVCGTKERKTHRFIPFEIHLWSFISRQPSQQIQQFPLFHIIRKACYKNSSNLHTKKPHPHIINQILLPYPQAKNLNKTQNPPQQHKIKIHWSFKKNILIPIMWIKNHYTLPTRIILTSNKNPINKNTSPNA